MLILGDFVMDVRCGVAVEILGDLVMGYSTSNIHNKVPNNLLLLHI
jgi:hypothetical protein